MRSKATAQPRFGVLALSAVILVIVNAVIWCAVISYDARASSAQEYSDVSVSTDNPEAVPPPAPKNIGIPVRIRIPSIGLDAAIEKVALATDGSMGVPAHPLDTGWYSLGPRPGETGSAAIAGHVDWYNGATAVFADLHKLKSGDKIVVQDDNGTVISFVVRGIRKYDPAADAFDVFASHDGRAHLNIITCDGIWDKLARQYSKRLVVFADKETE